MSISLLSILRESLGSPKALILAGAPGAGKGSILKDLDLNSLKTFNIDDEILSLSKTMDGGFSLNQKSTDSENRSKFMKAMALATKNLKNNILPQALSNKDSFILDGTSASVNNTLELKSQLEDLGYDVMMLYVYTDLETSLDRNEKRFEKSEGTDRSLMPSAILGTWKSVTKNFETYQKEFKNFVSVANTGNDETLKDIHKILDKYVKPFSVKSANQDPKSIERRKKQKEKLNQELDQILKSPQVNNIIKNSVSKEEAQKKITKFLS